MKFLAWPEAPFFLILPMVVYRRELRDQMCLYAAQTLALRVQLKVVKRS